MRVVIAEDLALLRDGLPRLLRDHGMDVVSAVEDGAAASTLVSACRFPPRGGRSYGPVRRSPRYAKPTPGVPAGPLEMVAGARKGWQ